MAVFTGASWGLFALRLTVGLIFLMHGVPKLFGGIYGTTVMLELLGVPAPGIAAWAVALLEVVGGAGLVMGTLTPVWNVLFTIEMAAAIALVHRPNGFYVVGPGENGIEFSLLLFAANVCLLLAGPGAWASSGRSWARRRA